MDGQHIKQVVKGQYRQAALNVRTVGASSCCGTRSVDGVNVDPITRGHYSVEDTAVLPNQAVSASFGCGNPTALIDLRPGEVVLDLGSGGGIDVLLSARRVGPTGKAYGLDMTEEMLALARDNQRQADVQNAEFLHGDIEHVPLPTASVDVVISNCVINLSPDKGKVLAEAFRVLRPEGRLAIADIVVHGNLPAAVRPSMALWAGCVAGALSDEDYQNKLHAAGFVDVAITPIRIYSADDVREFLTRSGLDVDSLAPMIDGKIMSAFIRAAKPQV